MKNIFAALSMCCLLSISQAQTYSVDRSYGTSCGVTTFNSIGGYQVNGGCQVITGVFGECEAFAKGTFIYPDGSMLAVYEIGTARTQGPGIIDALIGFVKLDANGQPDGSFGSGGTSAWYHPTNEFIGDITSVDTATGKIYVVGSAFIACFNASTGANIYYHRNIFVSSYIGVLGQPDGKAVVIGWRHHNSPPQGLFAIRYNTDGTIDNTYGSNFGAPPGNNPTSNNYPATSGRGFWQSTGKAVFCFIANERSSGDVNQYYLVRVNTNGTFDNTFGNGTPYTNTGFTTFGGCFHVQGGTEGFGFRKVAGDKMRLGSWTNNCGGKVMQFTANGAVDNSWGTGGSTILPVSPGESFIYDIVVDAATDKTFAVGQSQYGGLIYRLNSNGSLDNSFNGNGRTGPFNFNNGSVNIKNFRRAGLYSVDRIFVNWDHSGFNNHVAHMIIAPTNEQITIKAGCVNNETVLTVDEANNQACFNNYQWYKDGSPISGATGTSYTATANGAYFVKANYASGNNAPDLGPTGTTESNTLNINVGQVCNNPIPTLSEWGLIIFALLLLCTGAVAVWRARYGVARAKS